MTRGSRRGWSILAGLMLAANGAAVQAMEPGSWYGGIDYATGTLDDEAEFDLSMGSVRFGTVVSGNIRLEGRFGVGLDGDSKAVTVSNVPLNVDYDIDRFAGVYALFTIPVEPLTLYSVAGYTSVETTARASTLPGYPRLENSLTDRTGSGSVGIGVEYDMTDSVGVNVEAMRYASNFTTVSVGLRVAF